MKRILSLTIGVLIILGAIFWESALPAPAPVKIIPAIETPLTVIDRPLVQLSPQVSGAPVEFWRQAKINLSQIEQEIVKGVNDFREQNNLNRLLVNSRLITTAKKKGQYLIEHDLFDHNAGNISMSEWMADYFDSQPIWASENLALGYKTAPAVVQAWIDSTGHRRQMLNNNHQDIGVFVGVAKDGRMLAVLHMGGIIKWNY